MPEHIVNSEAMRDTQILILSDRLDDEIRDSVLAGLNATISHLRSHVIPSNRPN